MVGLNIKRLREQRGLTQTKLAKVVKIRQESLSRIELGRINPSLTTLERIAEVLGVSVGNLFGDKEYIESKS